MKKRIWAVLALCGVLLFSGAFYCRHHFTPARWASLGHRGNLVGSLLRQCDGFAGMTEAELDALLGPVSTGNWQGEPCRWYWIGGGRGLGWWPEYMVLYLADGTVGRVEFEKA